MSSPQADFFSHSGAERLAQRIRQYWLKQGFLVKTMLEQHSAPPASPYWVVRSDLLNGRPEKHFGESPGGNGQ